MYKLETHLHTAESSPCSNMPVNQTLEIYKKAGYDGVIITDHLNRTADGQKEGNSWQAAMIRFSAGYRTACKYSSKIGIDVFLGAELRFPMDENDFLLYGVTLDFLSAHEWIYEQSLKQFYPLAKKNQILIVQAHPFRTACTTANPELLDGVEIMNGNPRHNSRNDLAEKFAEKNQLIKLSGSDFHEKDDPCCGGITLFRQPKDIRDIVLDIKNKKYSPLLSPLV